MVRVVVEQVRILGICSMHSGVVVRNLPVCVYIAPTSTTRLIAILCFAGLQGQCKQAAALKCIIQLKYVTEASPPTLTH